MACGPASKCTAASGFVHKAHHDSKDDKEHEDSNVVGIREDGHYAIVEYMVEHAFEIEVGIEQTTHYDTKEKRRIDLFGGKGKSNGDHRWKKRPGRVYERTT